MPTTFFFDQQPRRLYTRRNRKDLSAVHSGSRYPPLKGKMGIGPYLHPGVTGAPTSSTAGQSYATSSTPKGHPHALPNIAEYHKMAKNKMDEGGVVDDDSMRFLFDEIRMRAPQILNQLSRMLYVFDNIDSVIPNGLRFQMKTSWPDLTENVVVIPREWQTAAMKEYHAIQSREKAEEAAAERTVSSPSQDSSARSEKSVLEMGKKSSASRHNLGSKFNLPEINEETERSSVKKTPTPKSPSLSRRNTIKKPQKIAILSESRSRGVDSRLSCE